MGAGAGPAGSAVVGPMFTPTLRHGPDSANLYSQLATMRVLPTVAKIHVSKNFPHLAQIMTQLLHSLAIFA